MNLYLQNIKNFKKNLWNTLKSLKNRALREIKRNKTIIKITFQRKKLSPDNTTKNKEQQKLKY